MKVIKRGARLDVEKIFSSRVGDVKISKILI